MGQFNAAVNTGVVPSPNAFPYAFHYFIMVCYSGSIAS